MKPTKKYIALLLAAILLTGLLASCKDKPDAPAATTDRGTLTAAPPDGGIPPITDEPGGGETPSNGVTVTFETVSVPINPANEFDGAKIIILPRLAPASPDTELIEGLVAEIAENNFRRTLPNLNAYFAEGVGVNYEVTEFLVTRFDDKIFSARVSGTVIFDMPGYRSEEFVYTVNLALTGGIAALDGRDIIRDFQPLRKLFTDGKFTREYGRSDLLTEMNLEDMIAQYPVVYEVYPQMYFTADRLVFNIDVNHHLGYNAGFSIPLTEVNAYLSDIVK